MRPIDSNVLSLVGRILGINRPSSPGPPELFDDDRLDQVLPVDKAIRRGAVEHINTGWYLATVLQEHAGAGGLSDTINPYALDGGAFVNPSFGGESGAAYPDPVPENLDVWLLGGMGEITSGGGTGGEAGYILLRIPQSQIGWTTNIVGEAEQMLPLGSFSSAVVFGGKTVMAEQGTDRIWVPMGYRVPRGTRLRFDSTGTGVQDITWRILLGLYPVGLGQDVAV